MEIWPEFDLGSVNEVEVCVCTFMFWFIFHQFRKCCYAYYHRPCINRFTLLWLGGTFWSTERAKSWFQSCQVLEMNSPLCSYRGICQIVLQR